MKKWISVMAVAFFIIFFGCTKIQSAQDVPRISRDELKAKLGSPGVLLIDVRADSDWGMSNEKITGAVRMDPATVDTWVATLPKDKEMILYCA